MSRPSKDDLQQWLDRWRVVNERQLEERRMATPAEKFRALEQLMNSRELFDMSSGDAADDAVRELWMRIRARMLPSG